MILCLLRCISLRGRRLEWFRFCERVDNRLALLSSFCPPFQLWKAACAVILPPIRILDWIAVLIKIVLAKENNTNRQNYEIIDLANNNIVSKDLDCFLPVHLVCGSWHWLRQTIFLATNDTHVFESFCKGTDYKFKIWQSFQKASLKIKTNLAEPPIRPKSVWAQKQLLSHPTDPRNSSQ